MATLNDAKVIYGSAATAGGFSNEESWVEVEYDFANDTGAIADYVIFTAGADLIITDYYMKVQTAVTSGGSLVMDVGVGAGGTEIASNIAVATMALNYVVGSATDKVRVASAGTVQMGIEAATALTGKISFFFKVKKDI